MVKSWSSRHKKSERPGLLGTNKNFDANQNQQYQQSQQYQPYQQYQPQGWCNQMMSVAYFGQQLLRWRPTEFAAVLRSIVQGNYKTAGFGF